MTNSIDPRRCELIAGHVLGDLDDAERDELEHSLSQDEEQLAFELERAAAAAQLAMASSDVELMPTDLLNSIRSDAGNYVGLSLVERGRDGSARETIDLVSPSNADLSGAGDGNSAALFRRIRESIAWVACAAAVLVCVSLLQNRTQPELPVASASELRQELLDQHDDELLRVSWSNGTTPFPSEVTGDVVWHNGTQTGFMRFVGLPINDASKEQYQLWIIDPARDDEPIDGGVFNADSEGEVIVPIVAKLGVIAPKAFAITIEKPGGVVVSTQERLPLLAAVE